MASISIIACIAKGNRAIGYKNRLLYHIPEDMARFRELTTSHTIIMGRKTFESLPHGALPQRKNIVISQTLKEIPGCEVATSIKEVLWDEYYKILGMEKEGSWIASAEELFVIGGERIYQEALPYADKLYLTVVDDTPQEADAFFPDFDLNEWKVAEKEMRNENGISFTFLTYEKQRFPLDFDY